MHGQALPEEEVSEEEGLEEDLSEADLAGWHGMSSAIPMPVNSDRTGFARSDWALKRTASVRNIGRA